MDDAELRELAQDLEGAINPDPDQVHKTAVSLTVGENGRVLIDLTDTSTDLHGKQFSAQNLNDILGCASGLKKGTVFSLHPDVRTIPQAPAAEVSL